MVATGRSMDWKTDMHSNLWVFPRGMKRNGETGENSLEWTSRYGSVVTSAFEIASTDGMNEKGLVANLLWLPETEYPVRDKNKPGLAITAWVQYMLDNFATVEEAVAYIDEDTFQVVSDMMPDGSRLATLHLSISDATGAAHGAKPPHLLRGGGPRGARLRSRTGVAGRRYRAGPAARTA